MKICRRLMVVVVLQCLIYSSAFSRPVPAAWQPAPVKRSVTNHWQTINVTPKPGLPKIHSYNKLNPVWWFGNIDDPVSPAWYRPDSHHRDFLWHLRNPFYNFDHYVIGIADKKFKRTSRISEGASESRSHWDFAVARRKLAVLPFFSYHRDRFNFYLGWRERGNFGIKLNFSNSNNTPGRKPAQNSSISSGGSGI